MYLSNEELLNIKGGFANVFLNVCKSIFNWGVSLGSSIRRLISNTLCPMQKGGFMILSNQELSEIQGGGTTFWLALGGVAVFLLGVFCGFFEQQKRGKICIYQMMNL